MVSHCGLLFVRVRSHTTHTYILNCSEIARVKGIRSVATFLFQGFSFLGVALTAECLVASRNHRSVAAVSIPVEQSRP